MDVGLRAYLTSRDEAAEGVLLDARDFEAVALIESLQVLERTVHNAEPGREVDHILLA